MFYRLSLMPAPFPGTHDTFEAQQGLPPQGKVFSGLNDGVFGHDDLHSGLKNDMRPQSLRMDAREGS